MTTPTIHPYQQRATERLLRRIQAMRTHIDNAIADMASREPEAFNQAMVEMGTAHVKGSVLATNDGHTPGRLAEHEGKIIGLDMPEVLHGLRGEYSGPYIVCQPALYSHTSTAEQEANTRRMVAAWNATRHMTLEQINTLEQKGA